ncbi:MAG TPA: hypothetical protein VJB05_02510 [archaeon]|nr:hypothetical protein [archaeon]
MLQGLTKELFDEPVSMGEQRELRDFYLREAMESTYEAAPMFANSSPRPPTRIFFDKGLKNTSTLAWYLDPREVKTTYPREGREIEMQLGSDEPLMAINPNLVYIKDWKKHRSIAAHEGRHGSQPAKLLLKSVYAMTDNGILPLGEMLIEGSVEWSMEQRNRKAPSTYMAEEHPRHTPMYTTFKNLIYDLEARQKGIVRQVYRAAQRGGPNAVVRLLNGVPGISELTNEYASKLNSRRNMPYARAA